MKNLTEIITETRAKHQVFTCPMTNFGGLCMMFADYDADPIAENKHIDNYGMEVVYVWGEYGNGIINPKRCLVKYGKNPDKIYNDGEDLEPYVYYCGQKYFCDNFMRTI